MSKYMSNRFSALEEYVPGEQPQDKVYIKLNTNESPYPPSKKVIDAVNDLAVGRLNLYPDPDCKKLVRVLAERYGVSDENIFLSNGSDDILNFAFMGFCDQEKEVAFPDISYGFYEVYANLYNLNYTKVPLKEDFSIDYKDYCNIGKNVVIANPNAPTGLVLSMEEVEEIVKSNSDYVVLIDEAYVDFGGNSVVELTKKYENLLVVQTFSKSRSMAGARLGFAIASKALIEDLNKIKYSTNPYNINYLTQIAGAAAIEDDAYYMENCKKIMQTRDNTKAELERRGFTLTDSHTNFLFAKSDRLSGKELYLGLKEKGVLVRYFAKPRLEEYLRITVGTPEEMTVFLEKVDELLEVSYAD